LILKGEIGQEVKMGKSILVVDDEKLMTSSLSLLLKKSGYDVSVAHSGKEAMQKVKEKDYNLIVADIRMPVIDGIETVVNIRKYLKQSRKGSIPEIIITGYADEKSYKKAKDLGVADYIFKPFDSNHILETVKNHIH